MTLTSYLRYALHTTANVVLNGIAPGRAFRHPGREPVAFPTSEAELAGIIAAADSVRVCGAGRVLGGAIRTSTRETLVSLDRMTGVTREPGSDTRYVVKGGTRIRDVSKALQRDGMALAGLPSYDAQSLAEALSADAHGTGRDWGFMSEHVASMRIVDGTGKAHVVDPSDALGRAAVGGFGAVGVITEATVEAVPRFRLEQRVAVSAFAAVQRDLAKLQAGNEHLSLYLFPFTDRCRILTWNRTSAAPTPLGHVRDRFALAVDALAGAWVRNALAYSRLLPRSSGAAHPSRAGATLVLDSARAFSRSRFPLHRELEFTVPSEVGLATCREFLALYERLYRAGESLPYARCEVRFTPAGHDRSLLGPGRDRRCCWIALVCNDSAGFETYYAEAESLARRIGARPHLGKYCESVDAEEMYRLYGPDFTTFQRLACQYDPRRRFVNAFTSRALGV
jgi:FAD/FMN-containing dehydrogenase